MQDVLNFVFLVELQIIALVCFFLVFANIWEFVSAKLRPSYPSCDIDPKCHPAFAWDKHGNGWIGDQMVISK